MEDDRTLDAVRRHIAAFNAHDSAAVLAGLTPDVVWSTGTDVVRGRAALADVFDAWLWSLEPELELRQLVVDGVHAAAQLIERLTVDGGRRECWIAAFFTISGGAISEAKVYREGTADLQA